MPGARGTSHSPQFPHFICVVAEDWEGPTQPFFFVCVKDRERRSTNRAVSLPCVFPLSCGLRWPQLRRAVMEFTSKKTASLALLCLKLSCLLLLLLLLPRASSAAPLSSKHTPVIRRPCVLLLRWLAYVSVCLSIPCFLSLATCCPVVFRRKPVADEEPPAARG
jgi:hypothetical protein